MSKSVLATMPRGSVTDRRFGRSDQPKHPRLKAGGLFGERDAGDRELLRTLHALISVKIFATRANWIQRISRERRGGVPLGREKPLSVKEFWRRQVTGLWPVTLELAGERATSSAQSALSPVPFSAVR